MYKHTPRTEQAPSDTQTPNTLPGMCQGEEEFSKSLHFHWKLCASPPTYSALCAPRNQHCLNLWYFNKCSCQAKDALRHITFVQRRIPAESKSRECDLCYKATHRYVKRVPIKNNCSACCLQWKGAQAAQRAHTRVTEGNKKSFHHTQRKTRRYKWMPLFYFVGTGWQKQVTGFGLHGKEGFSLFLESRFIFIIQSLELPWKQSATELLWQS